MPRVNYCRTRADDYEDLSKLLRVGAFLEHGSVKAAGGKMKTMCASTFNQKVKAPEKMTLEELRDARLTCKVDVDALVDVLKKLL